MKTVVTLAWCLLIRSKRVHPNNRYSHDNHRKPVFPVSSGDKHAWDTRGYNNSWATRRSYSVQEETSTSAIPVETTPTRSYSGIKIGSLHCMAFDELQPRPWYVWKCCIITFVERCAVVFVVVLGYLEFSFEAIAAFFVLQTGKRGTFLERFSLHRLSGAAWLWFQLLLYG